MFLLFNFFHPQCGSLKLVALLPLKEKPQEMVDPDESTVDCFFLFFLPFHFDREEAGLCPQKTQRVSEFTTTRNSSSLMMNIKSNTSLTEKCTLGICLLPLSAFFLFFFSYIYRGGVTVASVVWRAGWPRLNCVQDLIERRRAQKDCKHALLSLILCSWGEKKKKKTTFQSHCAPEAAVSIRSECMFPIRTQSNYQPARGSDVGSGGGDSSGSLLTPAIGRRFFLEVTSVLGKIKSCCWLPLGFMGSWFRCDADATWTPPPSIIEKLRLGLSTTAAMMSSACCTLISLTWPASDLWSRGAEDEPLSRNSPDLRGFPSLSNDIMSRCKTHTHTYMCCWCIVTPLTGRRGCRLGRLNRLDCAGIITASLVKM